MLEIINNVFINEEELIYSFIRSGGPGGQNVNKVETAVLLRFNVMDNTSLPEPIRTRLLILCKSKITYQGDLIIKASRFRTQERNKKDALDRLRDWIRKAAVIPKNRKKTKPTIASKLKRLKKKKLQAKKKSLRRNTDES